MLLLLDLSDLIGVLIVARVPRPGVARARPEQPGAPPTVSRAAAPGFQEPRVAGARRRDPLVLSRRPIDQTVGVGRCLPIAEIRAVPAPADAAGHARLLNRLAYQHAILLELFREDGVQEGIAAGVERQHEYREDLRLLEGHQLQPEGRREGEEGYRRPAEKIGEHEQRHSLRYARVVRVPRLRATYRAVHLQVASHQYQKGHAVNEHEEHDVRERRAAIGLEGQADGEFSVVRDSQQRQTRHRQREAPAYRHDVTRVLQREPLVQMHRVRYRVVPLQSDNGERVDAQFGAEDTEEAGQLATGRHLPRNRVHPEFSQCRRIDDG